MAKGHAHPLDLEVKLEKPLKFYTNAAIRWSPSIARYGFFMGAMFLYFTDWKVFMDKVPLYNKKFEEKEPLV